MNVTAKHGDSRRGKRTSEYAAWSNMVGRCTNPKHPAFKDYGARRIKVCARWRHSFAAFLQDMGRKLDPRLSLERRDNDGDYKPTNCYWADSKTQSRNSRHYHRPLKSHCVNGHRLTEANVYAQTSGPYVYRGCRICRREAAKRYSQRVYGTKSKRSK